jgi:hypothetical protein
MAFSYSQEINLTETVEPHPALRFNLGFENIRKYPLITPGSDNGKEEI